MASLTQWAWVWVNFRSWWWTRRPGMVHAVHGVAKSWTRLSDCTELNWTEWSSGFPYFFQFMSEFCNKMFMIWATVSLYSDKILNSDQFWKYLAKGSELICMCVLFSRQEYWSGLPTPSPGDRPNAGITPTSPIASWFYTLWVIREAEEYWKG